jgi:hypothetical protein
MIAQKSEIVQALTFLAITAALIIRGLKLQTMHHSLDHITRTGQFLFYL